MLNIINLSNKEEIIVKNNTVYNIIYIITVYFILRTIIIKQIFKNLSLLIKGKNIISVILKCMFFISLYLKINKIKTKK